MSFGTVISCMNGRIQEPVLEYLRKRFAVEYVDNITQAGPAAVLSKDPRSDSSNSLLKLVDISIQAHGSTRLAVVAHHDCAGNPVPAADQQHQLAICLRILSDRYPKIDLIALWLDEEFNIHEYTWG